MANNTKTPFFVVVMAVVAAMGGLLFGFDTGVISGAIPFLQQDFSNGEIRWQPNPAYEPSELICKRPDDHPELGIVKGEPIYRTFEKNPETFAYVVDPSLKKEAWIDFIP